MEGEAREISRHAEWSKIFMHVVNMERAVGGKCNGLAHSERGVDESRKTWRQKSILFAYLLLL